MLVISDRPRASRSSDFEITRAITPELYSTRSNYYYITPVLKSLHWLPVKFRILFKIAILTFKVLHGRSPDYLKEPVTLKDNSRYNFRSLNGLLLEIPRIKSKRHWVIALFQWQPQPYGTSYLKI